MSSRLFPLLALILLLFSCKTNQFLSNELPADQLRFGKGGGITGTFTTYILLENGQLFRHQSLGDTMDPLASLKRKEAQSHWRQVAELGLTSYAFDQPGNMTYFLEVRADSLTHRLQWNDRQPLDRPEVLEFYRQLMSGIQH